MAQPWNQSEVGATYAEQGKKAPPLVPFQTRVVQQARRSTAVSGLSIFWLRVLSIKTVFPFERKRNFDENSPYQSISPFCLLC